MASRRPLSARNVEHGHTAPKAKKERYPFAILDRSSLVETLKHIMKEAPLSPPVSVCEDDLARPTVCIHIGVYYRQSSITGLA